MEPFADEVTEEIYLTRFSTCAPPHVVVAAHKAIHLILAATQLSDLRFAGTPVKFRDRPGTFGVIVDDKWHVTFQWFNALGPRQLKFERRKPSSTQDLE